MRKYRFCYKLSNEPKGMGTKNMDDIDIPLATRKVRYQTLLEEQDYSVTKTTVLAGGETQWHHHTDVDDRFTVVRGILTVEWKSDGRIEKLAVPDYYAVPRGVSHHVKNETNDDVVYIMVQSGGKRNIVLEPDVTPPASFGAKVM